MDINTTTKKNNKIKMSYIVTKRMTYTDKSNQLLIFYKQLSQNQFDI